MYSCTLITSSHYSIKLDAEMFCNFSRLLQFFQLVLVLSFDWFIGKFPSLYLFLPPFHSLCRLSLPPPFLLSLTASLLHCPSLPFLSLTVLPLLIQTFPPTHWCILYIHADTRRHPKLIHSYGHALRQVFRLWLFHDY